MNDLTKATAHLPAKPIDEWSIEELLQDGARLGLMRLREFAARVCAEESGKPRQPWEYRLIVESSTTLAKLLANVTVEKFRAEQSAAQHEQFMQRVATFERELYSPTKPKK